VQKDAVDPGEAETTKRRRERDAGHRVFSTIKKGGRNHWGERGKTWSRRLHKKGGDLKEKRGGKPLPKGSERWGLKFIVAR